MSSFENQTTNQIEKLQYIEFLAYFDGAVNREDIINRFGVSKATATNLLATYNQIMPNNLRYNIRRKRYEISDEFKPAFNVRLLIERIPVYRIPMLNNLDENNGINRIAVISRAIQRTQSLKINYSSVSSGVGTRQIIPVAFADNILRWHLRAYDRKKNQFVDFVLARINSVDEIKPHELPNNDTQWHTFLELILKPHPHNLIDTHPFELGKEEYRTRIRAAMASYFLKLWGVDCSPDLSLEGKEYQYCLENLKEVSKIADLSIAPGYKEESEK